MKATLHLKLHTTPEQHAALCETLRQSTACFNVVCRQGWEHGERNGVRLHHATYQCLRERYDALPSQLVVSARVKATEAIKSVEERRKQGRVVTCPQSELCHVRYDARSYGVNLQDGGASLATVCGRVRVTFRLPDYCARYADWKPCSADLCLRNGVFFLHVVVEAEPPAAMTCAGVLGVDLGIAEIAVDSDGNAYSGARVKAVRRRVKRIRGLLQKRGTKSAKRHLKKIAQKQSRFVRDTNHIVSKSLVRTASNTRKALALEDLSGIRERASVSRELRWLLGNWAFYQLRQFVAYKAEAVGVPVVTVDPAYTSRTCSGCGYCDKGNRKSQRQFHCLHCGLTLHADFNAAKNVKTRAELSDGLLCQAGVSTFALGANPHALTGGL